MATRHAEIKIIKGKENVSFFVEDSMAFVNNIDAVIFLADIDSIIDVVKDHYYFESDGFLPSSTIEACKTLIKNPKLISTSLSNLKSRKIDLYGTSIQTVVDYNKESIDFRDKTDPFKVIRRDLIFNIFGEDPAG